MKKKSKITKNLKKGDKSTNNNIDNENLFEQCKERLLNEIQNFKKKYHKKESNKLFKTLYFSKYIESIGYTLNFSEINLIWSNHIFQPEFLKNLEEYPDYEQ